MTGHPDSFRANDSDRPCADNVLAPQSFTCSGANDFRNAVRLQESGLPRVDLVESNVPAGNSEEVIYYPDGRCSTALYDNHGRIRRLSTFDNVLFERLDLSESDLSGYLGGRSLPEGFTAWRVTGGKQGNSAAHNDKWVIARISRVEDGIRLDTIYPVPQKMLYRSNGDTEHSYPGGKTTTTQYRSTTRFPGTHKPVVVEGSVNGLRTCENAVKSDRPEVGERPLFVRENPARDYAPRNPQPFLERRTDIVPWWQSSPRLRFHEPANSESFYGPNSGHSRETWGGDSRQFPLDLRDLIVGFDVVTNGFANLRMANNLRGIEQNFYGRPAWDNGLRGFSNWGQERSLRYGGILPDFLRGGFANDGYGDITRYGVDPYVSDLYFGERYRRQAQFNRYL